MAWTTLVESKDLHARLDDPHVRIVDARFALMDPPAGRQAYVQSHVPGAVHVDLNEDLSDLSKHDEGRHPLPNDDAFARRVGELGITPADQIVVYDAGDGSMAAARFWWMMKVLGHANVAVLDGGIAAWRALGFPETDAPVRPSAQAPYPAQFDSSRIVSARDVVARLDDASGWLIDARAAERFRGEVEPIDPVAGHVPGAINRPYALNLRDGAFKPRDELRNELREVIADRDPRDLVLMCGSGVTACHLLLAFEHAGLQGPRVFAGSWSGWIADPARPVETGAPSNH